VGGRDGSEVALVGALFGPCDTRDNFLVRGDELSRTSRS
jgi:hypothetical protein